MSELFKSAKHIQFFPCKGLGIYVNGSGDFIGIDNIKYKAIIVDDRGAVSERGVLTPPTLYVDASLYDHRDMIVVDSIEIQDDVDELLSIVAVDEDYKGCPLEKVVCDTIFHILRASDVKIGHHAKEYIEELKLKNKYEEHFPNVEYDCW